MYKLVKNIRTNEVDHVQNLANMSFIPFDPTNTDYQQYLAWLEQGNQPLPADE